MWRRRISIRSTLTLFYGGVFFVACGLVIVAVYLLTRHTLGTQLQQADRTHITDQLFGSAVAKDKPLIRQEGGRQITVGDLQAQLANDQQRATEETLRSLLAQSLIAIGAVGLLAVGAGWLMAGRVLHPLHRITSTARGVAERNLHERIGMDGPADELKELSDTFDAMLERLDRAFDGQRRFVANASHELRTPLTTSRTLIQVAMGRPGASADLRELGEALLVVNTQQHALTDALLALARSEHPLADPVPVDLGRIAMGAVATVEAEARAGDVELRPACGTASTTGDAVLLDRLAHNLVCNGVRHNHSGGWVHIGTGDGDGHAWLEVANTGPVVSSAEADQIFQPFRQLSAERTGNGGGAGLGLSLVRSIVQAHGGRITARPREGGGLIVRVLLTQGPPASS